MAQGRGWPKAGYLPLVAANGSELIQAGAKRILSLRFIFIHYYFINCVRINLSKVYLVK